MPAASTTRDSLRELDRRWGTPLLLVAATVLLGFGLTMPLMHLEKLFWDSSYSVVTGVFGLWQDGQPVLAAVVFFWSVVFPVAKLGLLYGIWFGRIGRKRRAFVLKWLDILGKWSMLDVYIVAILIVAVKLGPLAEVRVEPGLYVFGAAVLATMFVGARVERFARQQGR